MLYPIYTPKAIVASDAHAWKFSSITCIFNQGKRLLQAKVEAVHCSSPARMSASHSNATSSEGGSSRSNTGVQYSVPGSATLCEVKLDEKTLAILSIDYFLDNPK